MDRLTDRLGRGLAWLVVAMVAIGASNAIVRYLGRFTGWSLSSNVYLELQWYLFSVVFLLGGATALRSGAHVRVDVLYARLSRRSRALVDLLGTILFLLPFGAFGLWVTWPAVASSWAVREQSPDPGGLPRYPIKAVILVAFALLLLQGTAELVKILAQWPGRGGTGREPTA